MIHAFSFLLICQGSDYWIPLKDTWIVRRITDRVRLILAGIVHVLVLPILPLLALCDVVDLTIDSDVRWLSVLPIEFREFSFREGLHRRHLAKI